MKKYFLFFVAPIFFSGMLIGCQTVGGPISSQTLTASSSAQVVPKKSRYCLVSDSEFSLYALGNRKQTSCDPAIVARYIVPYGTVVYWEFLNDRQIKTTIVSDPKNFRYGTKENPSISIDSYLRNGNIYVQTHWDGCKQTYEISKESEDSISIINRGASSNCNQAILRSNKNLLNKTEIYRKVYY